VSRPLVGVVGHRYVVPRLHVDLAVTGTPGPYVDRIVAAGGRPVVLPAGHAADLVDRVDALVLTGGGDVDAALYGGDPDSALDVDRRRDDEEITLVRSAAELGVPLLGVCRGLQVLTVAYGGTLVAHLGDSHRLLGAGHPVRSEPESLVASLLGPRVVTTSLHHQSVADPGPCWRVTARTDDGVGEAVEWIGPGGWDVLAVQWHPELDDDLTGERLFGWLVRTARRRTDRARRVFPRETRTNQRGNRPGAPSVHAVASTRDPA
jgi:putative glutamine amidotransferase